MKKSLRSMFVLAVALSLTLGMVACSDGGDDTSSSTATATSKYLVDGTGYDTLQEAVDSATDTTSTKALTIAAANTVVVNADITDEAAVTVDSEYTGDLAIDFGSHSFSGEGIDFGSAQVEIVSTGTVETSISSNNGAITFVDDFTGNFKGAITISGTSELKIAGNANLETSLLTVQDTATIAITAAPCLVIAQSDGLTTENVSVTTSEGESKPTIVLPTNDEGATNAFQDKAEVLNYAFRVGTDFYETFDDAVTAAESGGTVELLADASMTAEGYQLAKGLTVDLGSHTLTVTNSQTSGNAIVVNGDVTVKDGTLDVTATGSNGNYSGFSVVSGSLTLDNVAYTSHKMIAVKVVDGDLNIQSDSVVTATDGAWYAITTNATEQGSHTVSLNKATVVCHTDGDNDTTAICLNNGSDLSIVDSTVEGDRQVVMLRVGAATMRGSTLTQKNALDAQTVDSDVTTTGSGNEVPQGTLVVGNGENEGYDGDATVEFTGAMTITAAGDNPAIAMLGNSKHACTLTTNGNWKGTVRVYDTLAENSNHVFIDGTTYTGDTAGTTIVTLE